MTPAEGNSQPEAYIASACMLAQSEDLFVLLLLKCVS